MLNQVIIVGRLVSDPSIEEISDGKSMSVITISVQRSYKDMNGKYKTDFIDCILHDPLAKNTEEHCKRGDVIGIKGRIQNDEINGKMRLIAEKVTFLSSNKEE